MKVTSYSPAYERSHVRLCFGMPPNCRRTAVRVKRTFPHVHLATDLNSLLDQASHRNRTVSEHMIKVL